MTSTRRVTGNDFDSKQGETNRELAARLGDLAEKWTQGCETKEEQKDLVILEQLVNTLPEDVRIWVKERKPKTSMEAGQLADDYIQARKQNSGEPSAPVSRKSANIPTHPPVRSCHRCGKPGPTGIHCPPVGGRAHRDPLPASRRQGPRARCSRAKERERERGEPCESDDPLPTSQRQGHTW